MTCSLNIKISTQKKYHFQELQPESVPTSQYRGRRSHFCPFYRLIQAFQFMYVKYFFIQYLQVNGYFELNSSRTDIFTSEAQSSSSSWNVYLRDSGLARCYVCLIQALVATVDNKNLSSYYSLFPERSKTQSSFWGELTTKVKMKLRFDKGRCTLRWPIFVASHCRVKKLCL